MPLLDRNLLPWMVSWPPRGPDAAPRTSPPCCFPTRGADAPGDRVWLRFIPPSPQGSPVSGRRAVGPPRLSSRQPAQLRIAAVMLWNRTCNLLGFLRLYLCCWPVRLPLPCWSRWVNSLGPGFGSARLFDGRVALPAEGAAQQWRIPRVPPGKPEQAMRPSAPT